MKENNFFEIEKYRNIFFLLLLGIFLYLCIMMVLPFIKIVGWASTLAILWYPVHNFINRRFKNPTISSLISCFLVVVIVVVPATFLTIGLFQEGENLLKIIQKYIEEEKYTQFLNFFDSKIFKNSYKYFSKFYDFSKIDFKTIISGNLKQFSTFIGKQGVYLIRNTVVFIFQLGLTLVIFFFLLRDGKRIYFFIQPFIPLSSENTNLLISRATETIRATVYGWLVVGIIQGTLLGVIFAILGLPSPIFWGGVTILICFIPFVGAPVVWIPASIILAIKKIWWKAIVLFLFGATVINLADNFLRPILVGTKLKLHPMIIFFAIFGGVLFMGPLGLFLGPVILSITISLLEVLKMKLNQQENSKLPETEE
jgi:predicted PurR-regulated permease PerM